MEQNLRDIQKERGIEGREREKYTYSELSFVLGEDFGAEVMGGEEDVGGVREWRDVVVDEIVGADGHGEDGAIDQSLHRLLAPKDLSQLDLRVPEVLDLHIQ